MKIRSDVLRTYQSIHTWTGIIAGLVLFIGFYAGALSMFEDEISYWAAPTEHHLPAVPVEQVDVLVKTALAEYPDARKGFTVNFAPHLSTLTWFEQGGGRELHLDSVKRHATLSDSGELITHAEPTNELGDLIDMLHRTAGIAGKVGHEDLGVLVLGIAAVLYFLALVSGVIFLLPTLVKSFFAIRRNKGANRFWLDSHNLVGIISLPFHLIIAWTVVVFAFHDVLYGGLSLFYEDEAMFPPRPTSQVEFNVDTFPNIQNYLQQVDELTDGYVVKQIEFTGLQTPRATAAIKVYDPTAMMRFYSGDFIYMEPYSYQVGFASIPLKDNEYYVSLVKSFFSLHFGGNGGEVGRWLYFVMGLLGAFLFYSGNLIWLEKRRQKKPEQSRSTKFMASLTIGVCLGSMLAVATTLLLSKWLYLISNEVNYYYMTSYYVVFFAAVGYSFIRGAAISAIHCQYALALLCLLIPVTSLMAYFDLASGLSAANASLIWLLDVVALLFSISFYIAAKKTAARAYNGERNSIWALNKPNVASANIVTKAY